MDDAVWTAAIGDAERWQSYVPEAQYFEIEGELVSPAEMLFYVQMRIKDAIPPAERRWFRLRRHARVVGRAANVLRRVFTEVTFRPEHMGAKRSRDHFHALCASPRH
jgi:hypothetical protein